MKKQSIAETLIYQRKLKGLSQEQLAEKTRVTVRTIQRLEKAEVTPHLKTVKMLAAALEIEVDDLLQLDNPGNEAIQQKWLLLMHSAPFLGFVLPFMNILLPLFLWIHKREDNPVYEQHGRAVINFQLTMTLMFILAFIALLTIEGFGFLFFLAVLPYAVIVMLSNIVAVLHNKGCRYPLAIPFLKMNKAGIVGTVTLLCVLGLTDLIVAKPAFATPPNQPVNSISNEQLADFSKALDALRQQKHIPGLAVAIVADQQLRWSDGFGSSHFDTGDGNSYRKATADTPFWIASVTKPLLALLFLKLAEQDIVNLDKPINDMPGWQNFCGWLAQSTIIFGQDLRCNEKISIRNVLNHNVNGQPGTAFLYNPIMYSRLSRYLEYLHGNPVNAAEQGHNVMAQLMQKYILGPAAMERTTAGQWQSEKAGVFFDMAQGYQYSDGRYAKLLRPDRHFAGGAGIVSTANDLARFDIAFDTGAIASTAVMQTVFEPAKAPDGTALPYAFGWYVQHYNGEKLIWHGGWDEDAGFSALYLKIPGRNLTFIILANSEGMWWGNPLDKAQVENSPFAQVFLKHFVFTDN